MNLVNPVTTITNGNTLHLRQTCKSHEGPNSNILQIEKLVTTITNSRKIKLVTQSQQSLTVERQTGNTVSSH